MIKVITILAGLLLTTFVAIGQARDSKSIDLEVKRIDGDRSLIVREFDANEAYGRTFDGGGTIKVYLDKNEIKKVEEVIGLSYGRIGTVIYFMHDQPIKIVETEKDFPMNSEQTALDYSTLKKVFEATIYVFDWEGDKSETKIVGERVLSEGTCSVFEYEGTINKAKELLQNK